MRHRYPPKTVFAPLPAQMIDFELSCDIIWKRGQRSRQWREGKILMEFPAERVVKFILERYPDLIAIYLFGSSADESDNKESDVDLAVLSTNPLESCRMWDVSQELSLLMKQDVDLVDLRKASTVMHMQVISTGKCLYESDSLRRESFEDYVFSAYVRLNEERKEILKDVLARGVVYG